MKFPTLKGALLSLLSLAVYLGVMLVAWGDSSFFDHPARTGLLIVSIVLSIAFLFSGVGGFAVGKREDRGNRWVFVPLILLSLAFAWVAPWSDHRNFWVVDGDGLRYGGLLLFLLGALLRVWPVFVLGRRFSFVVAIQPEHALATTGVYRIIRHPSYLGALVAFFGMALVFRSLIGFVIAMLLVPVVIARMNAEEKLFAAEFGSQYDDYRRRTWRMLPYIY